jgi:CPA1 family monovalent cation:H+ antiporter
MHEEQLLTTTVIVVLLLFVAAISAIVTRKISFPYTVGLVVVGMLLGLAASEISWLAPMQEIELSREIILFVILPTLLFDAAINVHAKVLLKSIAPILVLATIGLLISTAIVGVGMGQFSPLPLGVALLFGALISATDPVAVIALFRELGVNEQLSTLVDGESLFNDATAIVVFNLILAIVLTSGGSLGEYPIAAAVGNFLLVFFGGLLVGVTLGVTLIVLMRLAGDDVLAQIALTSVIAYVAFIVADYFLGLSGVMAVVGAGVFAAWRAKQIFAQEIRRYIASYWEYAAFVANSLIFLLIGLTEFEHFENFAQRADHLAYVAAAIAIVLVARAVVVYGLTPVINALSKADPVDRPYQHVMFWGGLRGAIPLALVLGLPRDFAYRPLLLDLTFGVVLFSLLVQGTTINKMLQVLKLSKAS